MKGETGIAAAAAKLLQSCPTLCNHIDSSPPCSSVPGILQARTLEWAAISFSNAWEWKVKSLSCVWLFTTPWAAAYQAPPSMGFSRQEYWSGLPFPSPTGITGQFYIHNCIYGHRHSCHWWINTVQIPKEKDLADCTYDSKSLQKLNGNFCLYYFLVIYLIHKYSLL